MCCTCSNADRENEIVFIFIFNCVYHVTMDEPSEVLMSHHIPDCTVVTEHRGVVSPAIVEHTGIVHVAQDEGAVLLCVSQGCPTPEYR